MRLKPRVTLAKKIADSALAKEKKGHDDEWVRNAAEELGVDYDSEEFEAAGGGRKGRGTGRKMKEKEARGLTKAELGALRGELKSLLGTSLIISDNLPFHLEHSGAGFWVMLSELPKCLAPEFLKYPTKTY